MRRLRSSLRGVRRGAVASLGGCLLVACAGTPEVVSAGEVAEIAANGLGQAGVILSRDQWRTVGEQACGAEAWVHDNARSLATESSDRYQLPDPEAMATVVWMAAVTACGERIPDDLLRAGPPLTSEG